MADRPTFDRVARVVSFLAETTGTGVDDLYPEPPRRRGLLDGDSILEMWRAFQEDDERLRPFKLTTQRNQGRREPYGLYSLFYRRVGQTIPIYVGKGRLPYRPLAHLGLQNQYFDQVMAAYFGGIHGRPWREDVNRQVVLERLSRLQLGFCFCAVGAGSEAKRDSGQYETRFIDALHPVCNSKYYPPRIDHFDLDRLAEAWPNNGAGKDSISTDDLENLITSCLDCHRQCVLRGA
ncbi:MAG: hypothetical protein Q7W02_08360 [Candidatus Rokubacteria bacterium]|nr:hypothetical protein [Candidatus Rokubacteria bacterium]